MAVNSRAAIIYVLLSVLQSSACSNLPVALNTWRFTLASDKGYEVLMNGGSAMDGIVQGITACELKPCANNPLNPNVGFGGKPNEMGETTLDAIIMDGVTHSTGAVGGLRRIKNAIGVARAVMNYTKHSLLVGDEGDQESHCRPYNFPNKTRQRRDIEVTEDNHDTIGMVAVDSHGNVAAGCSTNGLGYKIPGRVGDSPIAGAGAYADNEVGAAAATGNGDIMIRFLPTYQTVEFMRQGHSPAKAAELALMRIHKYYKDTFSGSIIAVNKKGEYGAASYKWTKFEYSVRNPALGESTVIAKKPFDPAHVTEPPCVVSGRATGLGPSTIALFLPVIMLLYSAVVHCCM